jgi:hypothetical protein
MCIVVYYLGTLDTPHEGRDAGVELEDDIDEKFLKMVLWWTDPEDRVTP